ncbi:hypothetical protein AC1031_017243 [Aphanomyces cochlioides]|nr:hypothetical protein AC1031_017243 [Aphanomyces cochlioides]
MAQLCPGLAPVNFAQAKKDYADIAYAIQAVEAKPLATWYTDRSDYVSEATATLSACAPRNGRLDTLPVFVVYGLPNKDCSGNYSTGGTYANLNAADYQLFVSKLASLVGTQDVLYVLEPDAVGLLAESTTQCGWSNNYLPNLVTAVKVLTSSNPAAKLYVDVGWWIFKEDARVQRLVDIMATLSKAGKVQGIALNTANYRSNDELFNWCKVFVDATAGSNYTCVFDTARNYHGASPTGEWCNAKTAGIGMPPTSQTGLKNVDYFLWLKTPGQSDGLCLGQSSDALIGPTAGDFFYKGFCMMFDNGYFVDKGGLAKTNKFSLDGSSTSGVSGAVIGIILGSIIAVALAVLGVGLWMKKKKGARRAKKNHHPASTVTSLQT